LTPSALKAGQVYFMVCYEDDDLTRMVIQSYEYLGTEAPSVIEPGERAYRFRPMNPFAVGEQTEANAPTPYDGVFELTEKTLLSLHDLASLIDHLQRVQRYGAGRTWASDAS